ncbi:hypothetical protein CMV_026096 [Castanea mollissima]|uniref:Uncharacterized protein n=1 Tax=Castanea mollissima TaxID=60419 RepID=A0A8J4QMV4_9ROSI|nr:hypothetical protein CMV_026096 [Castanea mollissima]
MEVEDEIIEEEEEDEQGSGRGGEISNPPSSDSRQALLYEVVAQVTVLNSSFSWREPDCSAAKRATHVPVELAKNDRRRVCLHCGFAVITMDFRCGSSSLSWWRVSMVVGWVIDGGGILAIVVVVIGDGCVFTVDLLLLPWIFVVGQVHCGPGSLSTLL